MALAGPARAAGLDSGRYRGHGPLVPLGLLISRSTPPSRPVLALVGCGAGGITGLRTHLVEPLVADGWTVAVTLTPTAGTWFAADGEAARLEELTGLPVRWTSRLPGEPRPHPDPDVCAVVPATANAVAKLALGISDSQAMTVANEMIGREDVPVFMFPCINLAHTRHPAWPGHLSALRSAGVEVMTGEDVWPLLSPRSEPGLPWATILTAIRAKDFPRT